jgi:transcriptional regulator with XRE-family HTH domain
MSSKITVMTTLGERIKNLREGMGLSQSDFANKINIKSAAVLSRYESNQRQPDIETLAAIVKTTNCDYAWLLTGETRGPDRMKEVGARIKNLRDTMNLSQEAFAEKLSIPTRTYIRYEDGDFIIPADVLTRIADVTGHTVDRLVGSAEAAGQKNVFLNLELMTEIIETVEEIFLEEELYLSPRKKAELIILLYEDLLEDESKRENLGDRVIKLVKLAS